LDALSEVGLPSKSADEVVGQRTSPSNALMTVAGQQGVDKPLPHQIAGIWRSVWWSEDPSGRLVSLLLNPCQHDAALAWSYRELAMTAKKLNDDDNDDEWSTKFSDHKYSDLQTLEELFPLEEEDLKNLRVEILALRNEIFECTGMPRVTSLDFTPDSLEIDESHITTLQRIDPLMLKLLCATPAKDRVRLIGHAFGAYLLNESLKSESDIGCASGCVACDNRDYLQ